MKSVMDLRQRIEIAVSNELSALLGEEQFIFAAEQAVNELALTFPVTTGTLKLWAVERGKRHALDLLRTAAAYKFRYKQIHLNQRFQHLTTQIQEMDKAFAEALKTDPALLGANAFSIYIGNGYVYDQFGNCISKLLDEIGVDKAEYRNLFRY